MYEGYPPAIRDIALRAFDLADQSGHSFVTTGHVLVATATIDGDAVQSILLNLGVTAGDLEVELRRRNGSNRAFSGNQPRLHQETDRLFRKTERLARSLHRKAGLRDDSFNRATVSSLHMLLTILQMNDCTAYKMFMPASIRRIRQLALEALAAQGKADAVVIYNGTAYNCADVLTEWIARATDGMTAGDVLNAERMLTHAPQRV